MNSMNWFARYPTANPFTRRSQWMIYMVGVKVQTIRHVTVEATTIDEAEQLGLKEAMALVGGIDGTVLEVYSDPKQLIGEDWCQACEDGTCPDLSETED